MQAFNVTRKNFSFESVCWLFIFKNTEPSPLQDSCVCWLFIFKDTEPSPLQDSLSVRQQGGLPGPPPRSPPPRIHRRPGGLPWTAQHYCPVVSGPIVSRHWGPPRACHRVPCCEHAAVQRGYWGRMLNVPERKSHPRGKPLQPRFPKEPHHRRAADNSLTAKSRKHT